MTDSNVGNLWIAARFRDADVFAKCAADGTFDVSGGFVAMRYKPAGKAYKTRPDRLEVKDGAQPQGLPEPAANTPKKTSKGLAATSVWRSEDDAVQLWTDGACSGNPGPAGAGVWYRHRGDEKEISKYLGQGTNNIAELTAILLGLEMVDDGDTPVDVMTDSSYCIGLLSKGWKAKANQELVAALRREAARFTDLRLVKVKGHAGIPGNEKADELAVAAVQRRC